jgi:hypothetical protein
MTLGTLLPFSLLTFPKVYYICGWLSLNLYFCGIFHYYIELYCCLKTGFWHVFDFAHVLALGLLISYLLGGPAWEEWKKFVLAEAADPWIACGRIRRNRTWWTLRFQTRQPRPLMGYCS